MTRTSLLAVLVALTCIGTARLAAQKTATAPGLVAVSAVTIRAIDVPKRFVVLGRDDGSDVGVFAPPEFPRFDELRVGDRVNFTYYESTVYQLKRGPDFTEEVGAAESQSALPGVTFSHQITERVTVTAIDRKALQITTVGRDNRAVTRHVHNPSDLNGVRPGDHLEITYTEALLAGVTRAK